jgi:hypothetical protein
MALGDVDELECLVRHLGCRWQASRIRDQLAERRKVVVEAQPPTLPDGSSAPRRSPARVAGASPGGQLKVGDRGLAARRGAHRHRARSRPAARSDTGPPW